MADITQLTNSVSELTDGRVPFSRRGLLLDSSVMIDGLGAQEIGDAGTSSAQIASRFAFNAIPSYSATDPFVLDNPTDGSFDITTDLSNGDVVTIQSSTRDSAVFTATVTNASTRSFTYISGWRPIYVHFTEQLSGTADLIMETNSSFETRVERGIKQNVDTSTGTALTANTVRVLTSDQTYVLPDGPSEGCWVKLLNTSGSGVEISSTNENIMGAATNLVLPDNPNTSFELVYYNTAQGWIIID